MKIKKFMLDNRYESSGQIIILLAVSLLVLLIVAALAIDGGMVYSERRFSQNAADASSLAAGAWTANLFEENEVNSGNFNCSNLESYVVQGFNEAKLRATSNNYSNNFSGFVPDVADIASTQEEFDNYSEPNGMIAFCNAAETYIDIKVRITTETSTAFLHLLTPGTLKNTVEAVTRLDPRTFAGLGQGLVATCNNISDDTKEGIIISGTANAEVTGAGAFTNCSLIANGGGSIDATDGDISYIVGYDGPLENFEPDPTQASDVYDPPATSSIVTESDCIGFSSPLGDPRVHNNEIATLNPGTYESITQTGGVLVLNPGLYCITNTGGVDTTGGAFIGDGVTLFMLSGGVKITGNSGTIDGTEYYTSLRAPYQDIFREYSWYGYLIVMDDDNAPDNNPLKYSVDISGTTETNFTGTIYAPNHNVKLTGDSTTATEIVTFSTQVIGNTITIAGTPIIQIQYDPDYAPYFNPKLNLRK